MTAPGRFCCCGGTVDAPLEDCPLTLFDFPSECFAETYRLVVEDVVIQWCDDGTLCTETLAIQWDFDLGNNWQTLSATGVTITAGGTRWDVAQCYISCLDSSWADHPDGTSDYIMIYVEFRYDVSGDPCSMPGLVGLPEEGSIGLYLVSPTPRTTADVCIPAGTYVPFGAREGIVQQGNEPNEEVGDCADYDACDSSGTGSGRCIDSVGTVSVTVTT